MQSPALFHVLLDHLEANGTEPIDLQRFVNRWHRLDRTTRFRARSATSPARSSRSHCRRKVTSSHSNAQVVGRSSTYQSTGNATSSEMKGTGQNAGFHERIT